MAVRPTRYQIDRLLRLCLSLENPFNPRTRIGKAFARVMQALVAEQGGDHLSDLPASAQILTWQASMLRVRLAITDAHTIAESPEAPTTKEHDRYIAYLNSLTRILAGLRAIQRTPAPDVAALLARMGDGDTSPSPHSGAAAPARSGES